MNFVSKFLGTVRFRNDHIIRIIGYGDYQLGNVTISRVYYIEGLGHNLFSVGQFCDGDLEVTFQKNTCFIRNLEGVDLLSGSQDTNLYTISLDDMLRTSPICLLSKASKTKSWLWLRTFLSYQHSHRTPKLMNKLCYAIMMPSLTLVNQNIYKEALTHSCWIEVMQEELNEFERLEVWELVPPPDKVMFINLKWIYKVKLDELGGNLENKVDCWIENNILITGFHTWKMLRQSARRVVDPKHGIISCTRLDKEALYGLKQASHAIEFLIDKLGEEMFTLEESEENLVDDDEVGHIGVTYTEISSTFEELSDIGSPGVVPSPDYIPGLEEPQSPPPLDYVPEPIYPEYMPQEDEVFPAEEQPLPAAASPTGQSPNYVSESDPEADPEEDDNEDPKEDPVDYPADGGDEDDDEDESSKDDEDEEVDIEADDEEEEEHPAPANSVVVALLATY
ncbi:hypothetical protein Tco_0193678 [Tanacetum coccineum]